MRQTKLLSMLAGFGVLLLSSSLSWAITTWKVCDFSGDVFLTRGADKTAAVVGLDLAAGDAITIGDGAWVEVVSGGKCEVWELKGSRQYLLSEDNITTAEGDKVAPSHRLSVCYNPADFSVGKAQRIGGIIERGVSTGEKLSEVGSNAALINLIIFYGLNQGDIEKARPYFEALRDRAPGSEFVRNVAGLFERKPL
jgi:hypothetical protein